MNRFFSASPTIVRSLATLVCLGAVLAIGAPALAATVADAPYFADGRIHCPDGSTREYQGEVGSVGMRLACGFNTPRKSENTAQVPPAPTATAPLTLPIKGLDGLIHCPDGTTRPSLAGGDTSLTASMACAESASVAAERHRRVQLAMDEKNRATAIDAARSGKASTWAAIQTAWETQDQLLIAYLAGKLFFVLGLGWLVVYLIRR